MIKLNELKEGQIIYLEPQGNNARYSKEIEEDIITKVAKKYFYTENHGKFYIESMQQDCGQYISNYTAWISKQDLENKNTSIELSEKIKRFVLPSVGIEKLKQIWGILEN